MKMAVLADIHGNLEAFNAVLEDIEKNNVDEIFNLGDFIDYGPEPEEVARKIQALGIKTVLGNHEYSVIDDSLLDTFADNVVKSFLITKKLLSAETIKYIYSLPKILVENNCRFVHGTPPDSLDDYIILKTYKMLESIFQSFPEPIAFVGHSHIPIMFSFDGKRIVREQLFENDFKITKEQKHIICPGSVGQPRDTNKQAKYIVYDMQTATITVRYVSYNVKRTAKLIRQRGFPEYNAARLF